MNFLLDSDDDWIEGIRRFWYPLFHGFLSWFGQLIGIPLYTTAVTHRDEFVGVLGESEETIEEELNELGSHRNPVASYKRLFDGRKSEGSWVVTHKEAPDIVEEGMQLHLVLFPLLSSDKGRVVYAHYEDHWMASPLDHLQGANLSERKGVKKAKKFFDENTFLVLER